MQPPKQDFSDIGAVPIQEDFSDLEAEPVQANDFSDLGAEPVQAPDMAPEDQYQARRAELQKQQEAARAEGKECPHENDVQRTSADGLQF